MLSLFNIFAIYALNCFLLDPTVGYKVEEYDRWYDMGYQAYRMEYHTPDERGKLQRTSMIMVVPPKAAGRSCIISDCHFTIPGRDEDCPSIDVPNQYTLLMLSNSGAIYVASDYIGYAKSKERTPLYFRHRLNAQAQLDATKVAYDYLYNKLHIRKTHSLPLFITGASQGGAVAVNTQRLIEEDKKFLNQVNYQRTFACAGPYDMPTLLEQQVREKNFTYPLAAVLMYNDFRDNSEKGERYGQINFFTKDFIDSGIFQMIKERKKDGKEINDAAFRKFGVTEEGGERCLKMTDVFTKDFISRGETFEDMWEYAAQDRLPEDWKPQHQIHLYHSTDDEIVPYSQSEQLYKRLKAQGATCTFKNQAQSDIALGIDLLMDLTSWNIDLNIKHLNSCVAFYYVIADEIRDIISASTAQGEVH